MDYCSFALVFGLGLHLEVTLNKDLLRKMNMKDVIFVREGNRIIRLLTDDILFLEGFGDYVKVYRTTEKTLLLRVSLKRFEEILEKRLFCRVHRSYIVSVSRIDYIEHKRIRIGQTLIPISDSYQPALMRLLAIVE